MQLTDCTIFFNLFQKLDFHKLKLHCWNFCVVIVAQSNLIKEKQSIFLHIISQITHKLPYNLTYLRSWIKCHFIIIFQGRELFVSCFQLSLTNIIHLINLKNYIKLIKFNITIANSLQLFEEFKCKILMQEPLINSLLKMITY